MSPRFLVLCLLLALFSNASATSATLRRQMARATSRAMVANGGFPWDAKSWVQQFGHDFGLPIKSGRPSYPLTDVNKVASATLYANAGCSAVTVMSDVDDTIKSTGSYNPAGVDTSFPKATIYPGIQQFYYELSIGPNEKANGANGVVLLSARPETIPFLHIKPTDPISTSFAATGQANNNPAWKLKSARYGKVTDIFSKGGAEGVFKKFAQTKLNHLNEELKAHQNDKTCIVFVGDNGQGDFLAGANFYASANAAQKARVPAMFMHRATEDPIFRPSLSNIYVYETAAQAAAIAHKIGMISKAGLMRVKNAIVNSSAYKTLCAPTAANKPRGCALTNADLAKLTKYIASGQW